MAAVWKKAATMPAALRGHVPQGITNDSEWDDCTGLAANARLWAAKKAMLVLLSSQCRRAVGDPVGLLKLRRIESVDELRQVAPAWDELWGRGDTVLPTARAELLAHWIDHFAPGADVCALVVEDEGQMVAALPLYGGKISRLLRVGYLPGNAWTPAGDLLLDPQAPPDALDLLAGGINELGWPLAWLAGVQWNAPRWQALAAALSRAGLQFDVQSRFAVGRVEMLHDWPAFEKSWSQNHRRSLHKAARRADKAGATELKVYDRLPPDEVEPLLRRALEVEGRGWKGEGGTAVLRAPGMSEFFLGQAKLLAERGELQLVLLEHRGTPIAFEYGWSSKGVYSPLKVGYDEAYARLTPGQLLRWRLLQEFHRDRERRLVDFLGPSSRATAAWSTGTYTISRVVIAPDRPFSCLLMHAIRRWWPRVQGLRGRRTSASPRVPIEC